MRIKNNRTVWLINKKFQIKFITYSLVPMIMSVLSFWVSIEYFFHRMVSMGLQYHIPEGHGFYILLSSQKQIFTLIILFIFAFLSILFIVWGLFFSHRIAGPLYKLNKYFTDLKSSEEAKATPLKFRKGDFFQELPDSINHFFKKQP